MENTGLINRPPQPTEWMAGGETGIAQGDVFSWTSYLPYSERQSTSKFDTLACTHFASGHIFETFIIYLWKTNKLSSNAKLFFKQYLKDENDINSFRVSKQYSAIRGGNTKQGNYATNAWDTWRKIGCIPDSMLNTIELSKNWDEYHDPKHITPEMDALAKESLKYYDVMYQWVVNGSLFDFKKYLGTAPLNVGIPQAPYTNHSVQMYGVVDDFHWNLFNTYDPFLTNTDVQIGWSLQGVVTPKKPVDKPKYTFNNDLEKGMRGTEVYNLQLCLVNEGLLNKNLMNANPAQAFFGENTFLAVKAFQAKYDILTVGRVGKVTRSKLNELYS